MSLPLRCFQKKLRNQSAPNKCNTVCMMGSCSLMYGNSFEGISRMLFLLQSQFAFPRYTTKETLKETYVGDPPDSTWAVTKCRMVFAMCWLMRRMAKSLRCVLRLKKSSTSDCFVSDRRGRGWCASVGVGFDLVRVLQVVRVHLLVTTTLVPFQAQWRRSLTSKTVRWHHPSQRTSSRRFSWLPSLQSSTSDDELLPNFTQREPLQTHSCSLQRSLCQACPFAQPPRVRIQ